MRHRLNSPRRKTRVTSEKVKVLRLFPPCAIHWAALSVCVAAWFGCCSPSWAGMISLDERNLTEPSPLASTFGFATELECESRAEEARITAGPATPEGAAMSGDDSVRGRSTDVLDPSRRRSTGRVPSRISFPGSGNRIDEPICPFGPPTSLDPDSFHRSCGVDQAVFLNSFTARLFRPPR